MSGIYISGVQLPHGSRRAVSISVCQNGDVYYDGLTKIYSAAVPVPDHGDLIDRAQMRETAIYLLDKAETDLEANLVRKLWSHFGQLPVIIPGDGEGEP